MYVNIHILQTPSANLQHFKQASTTYSTDLLSALIYGNESVNSVSNVFFVSKDADKINAASEILSLVLPPDVKLLGCGKCFANDILKGVDLLNLSA